MKQVNFSYKGYAELVRTISDNGFKFINYHNLNFYGKPCIIRHDVDMDIKKAADFAEFEQSLGVTATYFVLLSTDFYNLMSGESQKCIRRILGGGHEIGLHFDEVRYQDDNTVENILKEKAVLENIIDCEVTTVSMHRPSKKTLAANYEIPGMVNSYAEKFFKEFKYWSDSHMRWREDVYGLLEQEKYDKVHLLTHPIWYAADEEKNISGILSEFIKRANKERYNSLYENFTDLEEIISRDNI